jgi:DNA-binding response OmpR family regulator
VGFSVKSPAVGRPALSVGGKPKIVLVEDQADVGIIIQKLGKRDGLDITWFPTAEEAWNFLAHERVDLLLLDINLPGMNGLELCARLRALEHFKQTPVAMFTPGHDAEHLEALRAAGGDFFVTKDLLCQPADWQRKIQELLQQIHQPAPH